MYKQEDVWKDCRETVITVVNKINVPSFSCINGPNPWVVWDVFMQGENLQGWGYSWALQEQWAPQLEALGGCNKAQQQWGHVCQLGQGTALQFWNVIPLLARSCAAEAPEWQEPVPGEFVMLELPHLPGTAKPPQEQQVSLPTRARSCLSLLPRQVRQRNLCLKAQGDSWEHELAKGNERTATTRWLMALIWTLLTVQRPAPLLRQINLVSCNMGTKGREATHWEMSESIQQ